MFVTSLASFSLPPPTKLRQGNTFSSVCQEFCSQVGEVPGQVPPRQVYLPWACTPAGQVPPGQVHPQAGTPPWAGTLPGRYTPRSGIPQAGTSPAQLPPGQVHPRTGTSPWAGTPQAGTPSGQVHPDRAGTPSWSLSWRYASYWNAFLLASTFSLTLNKEFYPWQFAPHILQFPSKVTRSFQNHKKNWIEQRLKEKKTNKFSP